MQKVQLNFVVNDLPRSYDFQAFSERRFNTAENVSSLIILTRENTVQIFMSDRSRGKRELSIFGEKIKRRTTVLQRKRVSAEREKIDPWRHRVNVRTS